MFKFQWIKYHLFIWSALNIMLVDATDSNTQSSRPTVPGSGKEEIALAENEPPGYRRYEHSNAWDYRTNWSNDSDRFLKGDLDMQNDHRNYGTDDPIQYQNSQHPNSQYHQDYPNNQSHQGYPNSQYQQHQQNYQNDQYHQNPNYRNSNQQGSNHQNYDPYTHNNQQSRNTNPQNNNHGNSQNNNYVNAPSHGSNNIPGVTQNGAKNTPGITANETSARTANGASANNDNSQLNNRRQRSWSYRYNWVDQHDAYLKGENQVAYNSRIRTDKQKANAKTASDQLAKTATNSQQNKNTQNNNNAQNRNDSNASKSN